MDWITISNSRDWAAISNSLSYWFFVIVVLVLVRYPIVWYLGLSSISRELAETKKAVLRLEQELAVLRPCLGEKTEGQ